MDRFIRAVMGILLAGTVSSARAQEPSGSCENAGVRVLLRTGAGDPRLAATEAALEGLFGAGMLRESAEAERVYCSRTGSWAVEPEARTEALTVLRRAWGEALRVEERAAGPAAPALVPVAGVSAGLKPIEVSLKNGDYGLLFDGRTRTAQTDAVPVVPSTLEGKGSALRRLDDSQVDFNAAAQDIDKACGQAKVELSAGLDALAREKTPDFRNSVAAFDRALAQYKEKLKPRLALSQVSTEKAVRDASRRCEVEASKFMLDVYMREDLYKAMKAAMARGEALNEEDSRLAQQTLKAFKDNGLDLPAKERARYKGIQQKLVDLGTAFEERMAETKDFVLMRREQLEGLPESYIARVQAHLLTEKQLEGLPKAFIQERLVKVGEKYLLTRDALEDPPKGMPADFEERLKGAEKTWRVSTQYPDVLPFLQNGRDAEARKAVSVLFNNRGGKENKERLAEMIRLREESAKLLGYENHASFMLEDRVAKTPATVTAFLERLRGKLEGKAAAERAELLALKNGMEGKASDGVLHPWDVAYYSNARMKQRYAVDREEVRNYFPSERVVGGMLDVYQKVLGVRFEEVQGAKTWHPDVKTYRVVDAKSGEALGQFYLDLYPREGKYTHAAAMDILPAYERKDGSYRLPVTAMVANMDKPSKEKPSLLSHDEVETIFHEFGHLMHNTLGRSSYHSLSGFNTVMDFVETPSQMFENWAWNEKVLAELSGDYRDPSKKIPAELARKLIAAKNADTGVTYLRQAFLASYDMALYTQGTQDTTELWGRMSREINHIPATEGTIPEASFAHIANGGYDAGYYSYLWSLVYAQDLYTRFQKDPYDERAGRELRDKVLSRGGTRDEMKDVEDFLGRKPNEEAFLKSIGIETQVPAAKVPAARGFSGLIENARKWADSLGKS
ncbi:MAG: M3 family metallopeptidase [Elusimicrobiota bacterium]|jgi:thimet oligopeptidase